MNKESVSSKCFRIVILMLIVGHSEEGSGARGRSGGGSCKLIFSLFN